MKKIIYLILLTLILVGLFFIFSQKSNVSETPLEQRVYLAPNFYTSLPSITGNISIQFGLDRLIINKSKDSSEDIRGSDINAPKWTLTEVKDRYVNFLLAKVTVVPANDEIKFLVREPLGKIGDFNIFSQKKVINEVVLTQEIVAEKVLQERSDLKLNIGIPYKDEPKQKFRNESEARVFLEEMINVFVYDENLLSDAADRFSELESNVFSLFGGLDPDGVENIKNWPPMLIKSVLYSELQQISLDMVAQEAFKEEGTVEGLCKKMYERADESTKKIIIDSLSCVSSTNDIMMLIKLDDYAEYCTDSRGFRDVVKNGTVDMKATSCE